MIKILLRLYNEEEAIYFAKGVLELLRNQAYPVEYQDYVDEGYVRSGYSGGRVSNGQST